MLFLQNQEAIAKSPEWIFLHSFFFASTVPRLSPKPQTMNNIKSKIKREASHATDFQHLECVKKKKKGIKIQIYSLLILKGLFKTQLWIVRPVGRRASASFLHQSAAQTLRVLPISGSNCR